MILITGATGLVGSHMLYELTSSGFNIKALRRKTSNLETVKETFKCHTDHYNTLIDKIEWVEGDINNKDSLEKITDNINTIYHCAAKVSFSKYDRELIHKTNIEGTRNIVDICIKKNIRLCFVSSIATMGDAENPYKYITENTPRKENGIHSEYSVSKYLSEKIVTSAIKNGLNAVIVNPSVILGFGHWTSGSSLLISTVAKKILFYTKGRTGFVDVRDVCRAMRLLTESNITGERFILNQGNYTYKELFILIAQYLQVRKPFIHATPLLTELAWRTGAFIKLITGKEPAITKETSRSSHNISFYSGEKIKNYLPDFKYTSFEKTIQDICSCYKLKHLK